MIDPEKRIKVAEACGWKKITQLDSGLHGWIELGPLEALPDYASSLDAMHEAEKVLTATQWPRYVTCLCGLTRDRNGEGLTHTTAAQRFEAFGKTLNLW